MWMTTTCCSRRRTFNSTIAISGVRDLRLEKHFHQITDMSARSLTLLIGSSHKLWAYAQRLKKACLNNKRRTEGLLTVITRKNCRVTSSSHTPAPRTQGVPPVAQEKRRMSSLATTAELTLELILSLKVCIPKDVFNKVPSSISVILASIATGMAAIWK